MLILLDPAHGHNTQLLVPETEDIPLKERVSRANAICTAQGTANVLLISIHTNAAGDGTRWHTATGWSCYTTKGHTLSATPTVLPSSSKTSSWTTNRISPTSSHKKADKK